MTAKRKIPGWAVKGGGDSKKKYTICFLLLEKGRLLPEEPISASFAPWLIKTRLFAAMTTKSCPRVSDVVILC